MRNLFIIGMLGVAAFMAGWFKINRDGDSTTIEINRAEIREDARKAIEKGREVLDRREMADQERYADGQDASYGSPMGPPIANGYPDQAGYQNQPPQRPTDVYDDRGFGQPAGYGAPAYPPSYGNGYPQGTNQYPGQSAQYPQQPQPNYPVR
ncbi:hypothetical protein K227x_19980 [Rubripirellula lacrimiformis]|uniref:Uncharacterized protein n=1 Tax=Rubripirellula lacrimiformis TaxID=1930273 RepID=A0A517N908_9BACT|nr:hypothetical protein [Rubripirellula lacrimiformis]QDT03614.1 hypothetical protein K227x_19980 [Rubripirellula lacrimiformis]